MKNSLYKCRWLVLFALLLSQVATAQQTNSSSQTGGIAGAPLGSTASPLRSTVMGFVHPKKINTTQYSTTTFTFRDITVFSYFGNTIVTILDNNGNKVGTDTLRADTLYSISPGQGIYTINGNQPYAVLIGDAITNYVNGYFALDQSGRGTSTKLNTWMMYSGSSSYDPHFIVFAYEDGTQFSIKDLATGAIIYAGTLDHGKHFDFPNVSSISDKALQVVSNKPVSALSYTDQDYYVPSANGLFAGTLFYGFSGYSGNWENSITITSYAENNAVLVTNLATGDTIAVGTLGLWQVKTIGIFKDTFWKIVSTGTVTAADIPFAGWTGSYAYMARCADSTGTNTGKAFVVPSIQSTVSIFSYDNNNRVVVTRLGDTTYPYMSPTHIADTLLQAGEGYIFSAGYGNNVFRIEGTGRVSVLQSNSGYGADFMPLGYALDLPDLAVSQSDISFTPQDSTYQTGEHIQIGVTVHNYGTVDASNISVVLYDGNPDVGVAPAIGSFTAPLVSTGGSYTGSVEYVVPANVQYHSIYVKVDPNNAITESNESNNIASRPLIANQDLLPPLSVYVTAPAALGIKDTNLVPNPFLVHADIFNTGTVDAQNVRIQFFVHNGLAVDSGSVDTTISSITGQGSLSIDWKVRAKKDSSGLNLYTIEIGGSNVSVKDVKRAVLVPDLIPPAVPIGLSATSPKFGQVRLTWNKNTERDLAGYKIYYSSSDTGFSGTGANEGPSPISVSTIDTFFVTGLTNGKTYRFALSAIDLSTNESARSSAVSVTIEHDIFLSVDSVSAHPRDTVTVPLRVIFPQGGSYSSAEVTLTGYRGGLQFLGLDTSASLIGSQGWLYQVNGSDTIVFTASAGAKDISGSGVLFKARFRVLDSTAEFIPVNIKHALFDTGFDSVVTANGGVKAILAPAYGDVDKNGKIQAADAAAILKYLVGIDSLDAQSLLNADVTNNGFVSALDATAILKYVVHLINSFPADSATMGPLTAQGVLSMNSSVSSSLNGIVEVPLNLSQGNNILSFEGKISFDPSGLSWQKVAWSPQLDSFTIILSVDSAKGIIRFAGAGSLPDGNEGTFASLFFLAKKNGTSKVTLEELRWNEGAKATNVSSTNIVTAVQNNEAEVPKEYTLSQNYPNPFNPSTTISYAVPSRSRVTLYIVNTLGQRVATLVEGEKSAGYYQVEWSPNVSSGVYFYRIEATSLNDPNKHFVAVKKLLLMK
ncbi:MAG: T9SS type A sorting domain-containing protein [Bacteroidota bacterium]|nr:T9SS type A sorting domain-containing protein [Bacteroidota bacterium]